ncbi:MAG: hypothetical protein ACRDT6_13240, partial [Micromonosporaceae bacterium]
MTQAPAPLPPPHLAPAPYPVRRGRGVLWRFWPEPPGAAPLGVYAAALAAAAVTAVTEPYATVGIAGVLAGLAVTAGPVAVVADSRAARWRLLRPLPVVAGLATLYLLLVGSIRDAGWLYVLCVLTALGLSGYALAAGRRWLGVLVGGFLAPVGLLRGVPWLWR